MTNIIKSRNADPAVLGSVLDQLFPKNLSALLDEHFWAPGPSAAWSVPPVNIRETAEGFELAMAAPGLRKSDFRLSIEGNTLTISADSVGNDRNAEAEAELNRVAKENPQVRWIMREFTQQNFKRHFELGDKLDRERIAARYDNGILYLNLARKEQMRPTARQIEIS